MARLPYTVPSARGASSVSQVGAGNRITSPDGQRWAISRNQKRALGNRTFDIVECWTLKERDENGKARTVQIQADEDTAKAFVAAAPKKGTAA